MQLIGVIAFSKWWFNIKVDFCNFDWKSSMQFSIAYIHKKTYFLPLKIIQSDSLKKVLYEYSFFFGFNLTKKN